VSNFGCAGLRLASDIIAKNVWFLDGLIHGPSWDITFKPKEPRR
jgi:hypothetical protein